MQSCDDAKSGGVTYFCQESPRLPFLLFRDFEDEDDVDYEDVDDGIIMSSLEEQSFALQTHFMNG